MKILALANAHALAHVSRLLEISKVLRARGHEVLFGGHGKYLQVATWDEFPIRELPYMPVEQAVAATQSQKLWNIYPHAQLGEFIEAELGLYDEYQPDLVLLDCRVTARTSADKAGLKTAAINNVHMSIHKRFPFFSASNVPAIENFPGIASLDYVCNASECLLYDKFVMGGLNKIRKSMGLERLHSYQHEEGDITMFADIPEFNPVRVLPPHGQYIGPLTWHNTLPKPTCLGQLRPDQPTVYLSLGSESLVELVAHLDLLARQGIQVIVATGAADSDDALVVPSGVFLEKYVNTDELLPHCDLVCCHGGNGTLYQALSYGVPLVVVATHEEQAYGGKRIQKLGLGRTMKLKTVRKHGFGVVVDAVTAVLQEPSYRERAREFSKKLEKWDSAETGATLVENSIAQ